IPVTDSTKHAEVRSHLVPVVHRQFGQAPRCHLSVLHAVSGLTDHNLCMGRGGILSGVAGEGLLVISSQPQLSNQRLARGWPECRRHRRSRASILLRLGPHRCSFLRRAPRRTDPSNARATNSTTSGEKVGLWRHLTGRVGEGEFGHGRRWERWLGDDSEGVPDCLVHGDDGGVVACAIGSLARGARGCLRLAGARVDVRLREVPWLQRAPRRIQFPELLDGYTSCFRRQIPHYHM
ncbi:hypothetical protein BHE74_00030081, partial [Ensete ventricosum]